MKRRWTEEQERDIIAAIAESAAEQIRHYREWSTMPREYRMGGIIAASYVARTIGVRLTGLSGSAIKDAIDTILKRMGENHVDD